MGDDDVRILDAHRCATRPAQRPSSAACSIRAPAASIPLNYLRGLAEGLDAPRRRDLSGQRRCSGSRRDNGGVIAETPAGVVRARQAIIATNSYSDLTPATSQMQRTLVPFRSAIIATEKLPRNLAGRLMPTGRTYTETKRMMRWFRMVDDRVVFGGRGAFGKQDSDAAFDALRKAMVGIFPELAEVPLAFKWSGLVGMTLDSVPHIGRLDDRRCLRWATTAQASRCRA